MEHLIMGLEAARQEELLRGKADFIMLAEAYGKKQAKIAVGHHG